MILAPYMADRARPTEKLSACTASRRCSVYLRIITTGIDTGAEDNNHTDSLALHLTQFSLPLLWGITVSPCISSRIITAA